MKLKELKEKRSKIYAEIQEKTKTAEKEKRGLTTEEKTAVDSLFDQMDTLKQDIRRAELLEETNREFEKDTERRAAEQGKSTDEVQDEKTAEKEAFRKILLFKDTALGRMTDTEKKVAHRLLYNQGVKVRDAMQAGDDSWGGALVPEEFRSQWEIALKHMSEIRQFATVLSTTTGRDMPMPHTDDTDNKGERLGEGGPATVQRVATGSKTLRAFIYSTKQIRISRALLQDEGVDAFMQTILRLMAERIARITTEEFATADGNNKPEGYAHPGNGAPIVTTEETELNRIALRELIHSVNRSYRTMPNAAFALSDAAEREIALMSVGSDDDRPLWQPSMREGIPATIEGFPYFVDPNLGAPDPGKVPIYFGDWNKFFIRDAASLEIQVLKEVRAENYEDVALGFSRHDSRLLDAGQGPIKGLELAGT